MPWATGKRGGAILEEEGYLEGAGIKWGGRLGEAHAGGQIVWGENIFAAVAGIDERTQKGTI